MTQTATEPVFLTPAQVAARWSNSITVGTLNNWRWKGVGPKYVKMRGRVLYRVADLKIYEASGTNEYGENHEN